MSRRTSVWGPLRASEDAVTPVIGSILILAMTVVGIAAVLFWGAPAVQGVQDQNSIAVAESEFLSVQRSSLDLAVPDAARLEEVSLAGGSLAFEQGTRIVLAVGHDSLNTDCVLDVDSGWQLGGDTLHVIPSDCRPVTACTAPGQVCLELFAVPGADPIPKNASVSASGGGYDISLGGTDFATGDWLIQLNDGNGSVYAQAWVLDTQRIVWNKQSTVTDASIILESGAVFTTQNGVTYLTRAPSIQEDAFSTGDYVARIPSYSVDSQREIAGADSARVFLGLTGSHLRISVEEATTLRYSFYGSISDAWCEMLQLRNNDLAAGASYNVIRPCSDETPYLSYTAPTTPYPLEFVHAKIRVQMFP